MARPREFDEDEALDAAMRLFWAKGYDGASVEDLLGAMRLGRGSLYKAFGSKRALYLSALARYEAQVVDGAVQLLRAQDGRDGRERIATLLRAVADETEHGGNPPGCFLCNAAVDQAPQDSEVAGSIAASLNRLDAAFAVALSAPDGRGAPPEDLEARAQRVTADYIGLRVLSRTGRAPAVLRRIAEQVIATL